MTKRDEEERLEVNYRDRGEQYKMKGRKVKLRNYAKGKVKEPEKRLGVVTAEEKRIQEKGERKGDEMRRSKD